MRKLRFVAALLAALSLLATACTSDKKTSTPTASTTSAAAAAGSSSANTSGDADYAKALAALSASSSFHALAQGSAGAPLKFDIHFSAAGSQAIVSGTGVDINLVSDGTNVYMKAPESVWAGNVASTVKNQATKLTLLASKWVKIDTSLDAFSSYDIFTNKAKYIQQLKADTTHYALGGTKTINGVETKVLNGSNGSVWYVEASGDGRPVETTGAGTSSGSSGSTTIDQYDQPFTPPLPAATDVVDYTQVVNS